MTSPDKLFGRLGNRMFQMAYLLAEIADKKIPDFYLQDPAYFERHADVIKKFYGQGIGFLSQVSIHVRRTDYVKEHKDFYVDLMATDYYDRAIAMFPNKQFLVFSDDPVWCEAQGIFKDKDKFQVMYKADEVEDLNLMASCEHNIIANSSYSWWGAYLNPNPSKMVVAPKEWYKDKIERTKCPKEWLRI